MYKIDLNNKYFYQYGKDEETHKRTKERLQQLIDLGCEEVGVSEFGIKDVFSGLYIERVWHFSKEDWDDYIDFINKLKINK